MKKGQTDFPIITFAIVLIGLILLAPIILKFVRSTIMPFSASLGNVTGGGGAIAQANVNYVLGVYTSFWDGVILICFLIAIILLFVSALLIDANPFFIILYIIVFFLTVVFAPNIMLAVNNIYDSSSFAGEVSLLPFIDFIRLNFGAILTAVGVITMIIIYAKIRYSNK
jgi:hypothetical protein